MLAEHGKTPIPTGSKSPKLAAPRRIGSKARFAGFMQKWALSVTVRFTLSAAAPLHIAAGFERPDDTIRLCPQCPAPDRQNSAIRRAHLASNANEQTS